MIITKLLVLSLLLSSILLKLKSNIVVQSISIFLSNTIFSILFITTNNSHNKEEVIFFAVMLAILGTVNSAIVLMVANKIKVVRSKDYLNNVDVMTGCYDE